MSHIDAPDTVITHLAAEAPSSGKPWALRNRGVNTNPRDIGLLALLVEDLRTHDGKLLKPGFWALALHRITNWKNAIRFRPFRIPFTLLCMALNIFITWVADIQLPHWVRVGRRVKLWHHGGVMLGAESIGDDVQIRHNTTLGVLSIAGDQRCPVIEDRVEIGAGAAVLGGVRVGHDSIVGANSVVVRDVPPHTTVFGVPARKVNL